MTASAATTLAGEERIPRVLFIALVVTLGTSSIVMSEPAPCDLLFLPLVGVLLFSARSLSPLPLGGPLIFGTLLFGLGNALALLVADHLLGAVRFTAITVYLFLFAYTIAVAIRRHGDAVLRPLFIGLSIAALLSAMIGILARFRLVPNPEIFFRDEHGMRIKSTFKDPNVFAPFLVSVLMWTLGTTLRERLRPRHLLAMTVYAVAILLSFSRGAYLNLAVCLATFLALQVFVLGDARTLKRLAITGFLFLAISIPTLLLALSTTSMADYFRERLSFQEYDNDRFGAQFHAFEVATRAPLGIGPGEWRGDVYEHAVHNLYLRVLVENGWIGAVGFVFCLVGVLGHALSGVFGRGRFASLYAVFLAVIVGTLAESIVIDTLHWRHLFLFIGMTLGLRMFESSARGRE